MLICIGMCVGKISSYTNLHPINRCFRCLILRSIANSIIIISLIASCISNFSQIQWVQKALAGINVAVAALLTKSVWDFSKKAVKNIWGLLLLLGAFISMYFFGVKSIVVILVSAALGICFSFLSAKKKAQEKKEGES